MQRPRSITSPYLLFPLEVTVGATVDVEFVELILLSNYLLVLPDRLVD